jgi:pimeloyl-ACP methyl ester carboxylesterase
MLDFHDPHLLDEVAGTTRLPDGRTMGYVLLGAADGPVVVVLDGPGSRGLGRAAARAAGELGLTLVLPDRPGMGASTPAPKRPIRDVGADVLAVIDNLGVRRFGVLGQSGGTPYALALAAAAGNRCTGVAFTGAVTPLGERDALADVGGQMRTLFVVARRAPWLLRPMIGAVARQTARDPEAAARRYAAGLPPADQEVLAQPAMRAIHERSSAEAIASPSAFASEVRKLTTPWDVDLERVVAPVALWAGELDVIHPPVMSRRLAARLGDPTVTVVPDAGTFALSAVYPDALRHAAALPVDAG